MRSRILIPPPLLLACLVAAVAAQPWAVIVSTSRFWFNYRHSANALLVYDLLRGRGVPDSHIILMLADQHACSAKNPFPGAVFADDSLQRNLYGGHVEVDFRGADVTADLLARLLTDRLPDHVPLSRRLQSGPNSSVLVYLTGHSATGLLKFQDSEELPAAALAATIHTMHALGRYRELLLIADTCHAAALFSDIRAPNVIAVGSSAAHEDSYSRRTAPAVGVHLVDRFSWHAVAAAAALPATTRATVASWFRSISPADVVSTPTLAVTEGCDADRTLLRGFIAWSPPPPRDTLFPAWPARSAAIEDSHALGGEGSTTDHAVRAARGVKEVEQPRNTRDGAWCDLRVRAAHHAIADELWEEERYESESERLRYAALLATVLGGGALLVTMCLLV